MTPNEAYLLLVSGLLGILGVPFTDWLKSKLNFSQEKALLLAGAVAAALGAGQLVIAGQLGWADFTAQNLIYTFAAIFTSAQVFFKMLKYGKAEA